MKPLISIVTPVYNSFHLMERFFESLEKQKNDKFEVIIVDDCSIDGSYEQLEERIKQNSFPCHLYRATNNGGPGAARNLGLSKSSGKYVTFVDSDDFVTDDYVESIVEMIDKYNPDAILFDYYKTNGTHEISCNTVLINKEEFLDIEDAVALSTGSTWCKVYKKEVLKNHNITFPNLMRSEDLAFNKVALSVCQNIFYLKKNLYYYYENNQSIMHNFKTLDISNNKLAFQYIEDHLKLHDALEMIFIREYLYLITQIMILKNYRSKDIKAFIQECEEKFPHWYTNKYIKNQPKYLQVMLFLIRHKIVFPLKMIFQLKK